MPKEPKFRKAEFMGLRLVIKIGIDLCCSSILTQRDCLDYNP